MNRKKTNSISEKKQVLLIKVYKGTDFLCRENIGVCYQFPFFLASKGTHRPSRRTKAPPSTRITVATILTLAFVATRRPVGSLRADFLTERPRPSGGTVTCARDMVTCTTILAPALVLTILWILNIASYSALYSHAVYIYCKQ